MVLSLTGFMKPFENITVQRSPYRVIPNADHLIPPIEMLWIVGSEVVVLEYRYCAFNVKCLGTVQKLDE